MDWLNELEFVYVVIKAIIDIEYVSGMELRLVGKLYCYKIKTNENIWYDAGIWKYWL